MAGRPPNKDIPGERRSVHFDPDAFKQAEKIRKAEGLSRSRLVCLAIEHYARDKKYS